ncbi:MAG: hypothetical protein EOM92_20165 [Gammaproteobacteria bacterium]|nr:hypothetical protein [Gammaproteobacteria bacterium]
MIANARSPISRYAGWRPRGARLVLVALTLLTLYGLGWVIAHPSQKATPGEDPAIDKGDVALYRAIVGHMAAGEDYYGAVAREQHGRGYPTRPFLTWRLPTLAWVIAWLGESLAMHLLRVLALVTILAWMLAMKDTGLGRYAMIAGGLLVYFNLVIVVPPSKVVYLHEVWAGTLMALSLALHRRWSFLSVLCGLAALAVRELALPFVLAMAFWALREGRWSEVTGWGLGILAFALGLVAHAGQVVDLIRPDALRGPGWLALGGWPFLLKVNQWNLLTVGLGGLLSAPWVPLALLGAAAWPDPLGRRLMLVVWGYSLAFLVVGRSDNGYWGLIHGPLVAISLVFAPLALRDLWRAARPRRPDPLGC